MKLGWIIYAKNETRLTTADYGVNRLREEARKRGVQIRVYSPDQFELIVNKNDRKSILINGKPEKLPDFVIPRMGSGTTYYALAVLRHLKHMGVYLCNGPESIEIVKDKLHMHQLLAQSNLPTPKTMLGKFPISPKFIREEIGFPVVIKNIVGTEGKGIYLCKDESDFEDIMDLIYSNNKSANIILQEYVASSCGVDLRIFMVGGKAIGAMKRKASKGFKANFTLGGTVEPFVLNNKLEWLASEVIRLANLDIAGIDVLFCDNDNYKICEVNSSPGFKGMELAQGKGIAGQIIDYILTTLPG
ncbi:Ribosomal protein S6 modification protein 1 [Waddlia chondrophila 2032/99]|uniref:Ribosomal protein S6 modification protein n=2 Tax=Waddlia chondrophila TaxID=71667 RepID=D6YWF8_WADCW|nr:RimK family alpha-L-glutamate ligase [Waddlia chondrophila]ADI38469.1 ribosomal protein S6 modification protein [Waddlia chondrophila WSU 86-1044]CCB91551.1 Ribosomal protein S6 modification protein 1 [Waddlia chondrophila 2032/99]